MSFLEDSDGVLYQEDESDVLVQVSLPPGTRAAHVSVALQAALKLEVAVQGRPVLAGVLTERVKEPIWTLDVQTGTLELQLRKQLRETTRRWGRVFARIDEGRRAVVRPPIRDKKSNDNQMQEMEKRRAEEPLVPPSVKRLLLTTLVLFIASLIAGFWLFK